MNEPKAMQGESCMFEQEDKWVGIEEAADYLGVN